MCVGVVAYQILIHLKWQFRIYLNNVDIYTNAEAELSNLYKYQ